ncbi:hypothetical protein KUTeg_014874 [Tegillarca granosa]|uniref:Sulfatase N-terminal domain-containing protein n=1 Tax=Tegillarca granosa TaxID=220873 RepID=A0ABQ9ET59_TEGGR|nr:hypothetical protein KUTeg_014874 [Tegillarca granosa]
MTLQIYSMDYKCFLLCVAVIDLIIVVDGATRPHIVVIVADDLGWNDVSFHGSKQIPTPNIDNLAYDGIILNNYYVSPICTPTRGALMTGRHPIHTGLQHGVILGAEPYGLPLNETIMPQYLKTLGYRTHMVGKLLPFSFQWHLGFFQKAYEPVARGFETHYGYYQGCGDYYDHSYEAVEWHLGFYKAEHTPIQRGFDTYRGHYLGCGDYYIHASEPVEGWFGYDFRRNATLDYSAIGQYSTELFNNEAVKIINQHNVSEVRFWVFYYTNSQSCMVSALDDSVGNVVNALKKKGLYDNSIIVFTTDNGGPANGFDGNAANNSPLRGLKATLWEGGVRGVGFIHSPLLKTKSYVAEQLIHVCDWMPTLFRAAGGDPSTLKNSDGLDLWEMLSNNAKAIRTEVLHNIDPKEKKGAIRVGDYKLLVGGINMNHDGWYPPWQVEEDSKTHHVDFIKKFNKRSIGNTFEIEQFENIPESMSLGTSGMSLGTPVKVKCGVKPANASTNCEPLKAACLYHIPSDPCEFNNIALQNKDTVQKLLDRLNEYANTMVPPLNKPQDPAGNPQNNNGAWVPWM